MENRREEEKPAVEDKSPRVGDILPQVLATLGLEEKFEEGRLLKRWPEVVGEVIANRSRPRVLTDGILHIEVEGSVWMQELWFHQREIIERVRETFPKLTVTGIRLEIKREHQ
jgi:predicted nucleic acid-binding Zn ribbon protein